MPQRGARQAILNGRRGPLGAVLAGLLIAVATQARIDAQPASARPDTRLKEAARAFDRGDSARAYDLGSAFVKAHPRDSAARVLLARIHLGRNELDDAYEQLDIGLRADPRNVDVLAYLGFVSGQLAAAAFERLSTEAPNSARARQLMGETFEAQDERANAEAAYAAALEADPHLLDALLALGKLKRIRLACEEAIPLYQRAESLQRTFESAYGLGVCHAYMQDDKAATARFEQAIERDPTAGVAWAGLGTALVRQGRTREGIAALERAVVIEPGMADAHYMLGMAYTSSGDPARAKAAFAAAERLRANGVQ
jgi:tetratricopeptide (TPR) repeat protein